MIWGFVAGVSAFSVPADQDAAFAQTLFEKISLQPSEHLLDEPPEMDAKRRADMELLAKLRSARRALETMG